MSAWICCISDRHVITPLLLAALLLAGCGTTTVAPGGPAATAYPPPGDALQPEATPLAAYPPPDEPAAEQTPAVPDTAATPPAVQAVTAFPDPAGFVWKPLAGGLVKPVDLADPGDGSGRLLIVEQGGLIRVWQGGQVLPQPFLDLRAQVATGGSEQGLLGLALDPDFARSGIFYLNYTDRNGDTVVARYRAAPGAAQVDPAGEEALLRQKQPYPNHNGGGLAFGPDGALYVGLGDGGSGGDPQGNGQALNTWLGKLLRLEVRTPQTGYTVPPDNPFVGRAGVLPEIWAYGLRNPWRFSFDPLSGDLYLGDVGQNQWEEIDYLPAGTPGGVNFGWNWREGRHTYAAQPPEGMAFTDPVWEYDHQQGCSVTGGVVVRDPSLPEWQGVYLFGDFCRGTVWGLLHDAQGRWQAQQLFASGLSISSFALDRSGRVYLLDLNGTVARLERR